MSLEKLGIFLLIQRFWDLFVGLFVATVSLLLIALMITAPKTLFFFVPLCLVIGYKWRKLHKQMRQELDEQQRYNLEERRKLEEKMKTKYVIIQGEENWKKHYQPKE